MKKIAVFAVVAGLVAALGLAGCASEPSPSDVTSKALDAIKAQDSETLQTYYNGEAGSMNVQDMASQMSGMDLSTVTEEQKAKAEQLLGVLTDFDYKIDKETIEGDKATVEVTITSHDLGTVFTQALEAYFTQAFSSALNGASQEELSNMFLDVLNEKAAAQTEKNHTATTTFNLTKGQDGWKLDELSTENIDCIMGGMLTGAQDALGSLESMLGSSSTSAGQAA